MNLAANIVLYIKEGWCWWLKGTDLEEEDDKEKEKGKKNWWNWIFSLVWEGIEENELANEVKASEELENSTGLGQIWVRAHIFTKKTFIY
jgi:hypothetical protein